MVHPVLNEKKETGQEAFPIGQSRLENQPRIDHNPTTTTPLIVVEHLDHVVLTMCPAQGLVISAIGGEYAIWLEISTLRQEVQEVARGVAQGKMSIIEMRSREKRKSFGQTYQNRKARNRQCQVNPRVGLRISEALALKRSDLDWLNRRLRVERAIVCQIVNDVKTLESQQDLRVATEIMYSS